MNDTKNFIAPFRYRVATSSVVLFSAMLLSTSQGMAKTSPTTVLNPTVTQAILTASSNDVATSNVNVSYQEGQDGGEEDISVGEIPPDVRVDTPTPPPMIAQPTISPDIPDPNQVSQVPLGAVSPATVAKFVKVIDVVRQDYVDNVDDEKLFSNAMTGVLASLDPYSEYLDSQAFENLRLFTEGDMGSIGVKVSYHADSNAWVFDEVLPNSPAAQVGIQRGNYLHQINDNKLLDDQTQMDVEQLLSGIAGTQVRLVVSDKGRRKRTQTVQRTLVQQQMLNAKVVQGIAIVHIPIFQNNTQQQFLDALANLRQPFSAIIIDLRNNPGGVLSAANDVASLFMKDSAVAQVKNRQGLQEIIKTHGEAKFAQIPLAVVQNRYSASAAEVLSNSLQENNRARVYGEISYGKGSIQSIVPINDNEAVKLTVSHYYSGKGKTIDGIGVTPDTPLSGSELDWEAQVINNMLAIPRPNLYQLAPNAVTTQEF